MRLNRVIFPIFFNMKVYCVFSLESPHRRDYNEYTQYTIFNMNKKNTLYYPKSAAMGFFLRVETAMINDPSVFEPLEFYLYWLYQQNTACVVMQWLQLSHDITISSR